MDPAKVSEELEKNLECIEKTTTSLDGLTTNEESKDIKINDDLPQSFINLITKIASNLEIILNLNTKISDFCKSNIKLFSSDGTCKTFYSTIEVEITNKHKNFKAWLEGHKDKETIKKNYHMLIKADQDTSSFIYKLEKCFKEGIETKTLVKIMNIFPKAACYELKNKIWTHLNQINNLRLCCEKIFDQHVNYFCVEDDGLRAISLASKSIEEETNKYRKKMTTFNSTKASNGQIKRVLETFEYETRHIWLKLKEIVANWNKNEAMIEFIKFNLTGVILELQENINMNLIKIDLDIELLKNKFNATNEHLFNEADALQFHSLHIKWKDEQYSEYQTLVEKRHWNIKKEDAIKVIHDLRVAKTETDKIVNQFNSFRSNENQLTLIPEFTKGNEVTTKIQAQISANLIKIRQLMNWCSKLKTENPKFFFNKEYVKEAIMLAKFILHDTWNSYEKKVNDINEKIAGNSIEQVKKQLNELKKETDRWKLQLEAIKSTDNDLESIWKFMAISEKGAITALKEEISKEILGTWKLANRIKNTGQKIVKIFEDQDDMKKLFILANRKVDQKCSYFEKELVKVELKNSKNIKQELTRILIQIKELSNELWCIYSVTCNKTILDEFVQITPIGRLKTIKNNIRENANQIILTINSIIPQRKWNCEKFPMLCEKEKNEIKTELCLTQIEMNSWCKKQIALAYGDIWFLQPIEVNVQLKQFSKIKHDTEVIIISLDNISKILDDQKAICEFIELKTKLSFDSLKKGMENSLNAIKFSVDIMNKTWKCSETTITVINNFTTHRDLNYNKKIGKLYTHLLLLERNEIANDLIDLQKRTKKCAKAFKILITDPQHKEAVEKFILPTMSDKQLKYAPWGIGMDEFSEWVLSNFKVHEENTLNHSIKPIEILDSESEEIAFKKDCLHKYKPTFSENDNFHKTTQYDILNYEKRTTQEVELLDTNHLHSRTDIWEGSYVEEYNLGI